MLMLPTVAEEMGGDEVMACVCAVGGIYGRMARKPVIDFEAVDVAVLVPREETP